MALHGSARLVTAVMACARRNIEAPRAGCIDYVYPHYSLYRNPCQCANFREKPVPTKYSSYFLIWRVSATRRMRWLAGYCDSPPAMVFRKISEDIKKRALWLYDNNYVPDDIAHILGVSERSFWRWKRNMGLYDSVTPPQIRDRGRPRILNADHTHDLLTLMQEAPELYLDEIQEWLILAHDVGIGRSTLDQNLRDIGVTYKLLRKAASERDEERRQEFMEYARNNWVASQLVFVDESSKDDRTIYRHYGRAILGQRAEISAPFIRGVRYSLVAALSLDGYMTQRVVEGSVDGQEFFDFIVEEVVCLRNLHHCLAQIS